MAEKDHKELNYWPYAIAGMILTVVMLGIWTIKIAVKNPVQESNSYMMSYQEVDENINVILEKKAKFDAAYRIDLSDNDLHIGSNRIVVKVMKKDGDPADHFELFAIVQRPTTNKDNIELKKFRCQEGRCVSEPFEIKKGGRWNIDAKVTVGDAVGYKTWKSFIPPKNPSS